MSLDQSEDKTVAWSVSGSVECNEPTADEHSVLVGSPFRADRQHRGLQKYNCNSNDVAVTDWEDGLINAYCGRPTSPDDVTQLSFERSSPSQFWRRSSPTDPCDAPDSKRSPAALTDHVNKTAIRSVIPDSASASVSPVH